MLLHIFMELVLHLQKIIEVADISAETRTMI